MKFRKKPIVIEAVRLGWDTWSEMCDHVGVGKLSDGKPEGCYLSPNGKPRKGYEGTDKMGLLIPTCKGLMIVIQGDWIIKDINGELDSCTSDIFEKTYESCEK